MLFMALTVQLSFAQERTISGTVTDNSGLPLPGATVLVKGTTSGASADFDGNFSIQANQGDALVFSYVGYATQEVVVGSSSTIDVKLIEDAQALQEVVVTALGIKREKASLGSAVTSIGTEELNEGSQANIADAIKGKVAGVVLGGMYQQQEALDSGVSDNGFLLSAAYDINEVTLKAQFADMENKGDSWSVGADYSLGKPTKLFAFFTANSFDSNDQDDNYVGVGVEHKF